MIAKGRMDVTTLQDNLSWALKDMQVRSAPVCLAREQLFSEAMDELIRQVLLENPERGLMLLKVRDEIRLKFSVDLEILRSTLNLSCGKLSEAEQHSGTVSGALTETVADMQRMIDEKKAYKESLQVRQLELQQKLIDTEDEMTRNQLDEDRKFDKQKAKLVTQANTLQRFIDSLVIEETEKGGKKRKKVSGRGEKKGNGPDRSEPVARTLVNGAF